MSSKKADNKPWIVSYLRTNSDLYTRTKAPGKRRIYFLLQKSQLFPGLIQYPTQKVPGRYISSRVKKPGLSHENSPSNEAV